MNHAVWQGKEATMTKSYLHISFVLFILAISLPACNNSTEPSPASMAKVFQIHLQSEYADTPVIVYVDSSQIFYDTVSTGQILGVAKVITEQIANGTHSLRITIPNSASKDTTFTVIDTLFIGVGYDKQLSRIQYYFTRTRFIYD